MSLEGKGAIVGMLQLMRVELAWIGLHALTHSQQCDAVPMKKVNERVIAILLDAVQANLADGESQN